MVIETELHNISCWKWRICVVCTDFSSLVKALHQSTSKHNLASSPTHILCDRTTYDPTIQVNLSLEDTLNRSFQKFQTDFTVTFSLRWQFVQHSAVCLSSDLITLRNLGLGKPFALRLYQDWTEGRCARLCCYYTHLKIRALLRKTSQPIRNIRF